VLVTAFFLLLWWSSDLERALGVNLFLSSRNQGLPCWRASNISGLGWSAIETIDFNRGWNAVGKINGQPHLQNEVHVRFHCQDLSVCSLRKNSSFLSLPFCHWQCQSFSVGPSYFACLV